MIILIFGKSGSGKTYLAKYLEKNLTNSIHIDIDKLNNDLYKSPRVQNKAVEIFGKDIVVNKTIDKQALYNIINTDEKIYKTWVDYMITECQQFLDLYMKSTSFNYYIIDHINVHLFNFLDNNIVKILCEENDDNIRYARLAKRDKISKETILFRDKHYIESDGDITYSGTSTDDILNEIKKQRILINTKSWTILI